MASNFVTPVLYAAFVAIATAACSDNDPQMIELGLLADPPFEVTGCRDAYAQSPNICDTVSACCFTCQCNNETVADVYNDPDLPYWDLTFVPYDSDEPITPEPCGYVYGDPNRKHFHLALPPNSSASAPSPVLFWSHGNGGFAWEMITSDLGFVRSAMNFAVVSWESVTPVASDNDTLQCQQDFELVLDWVADNGADYNMSTDFWIVGGRSRGSGCSWAAANNVIETRPAIRGMYLYNALPIEDDAKWENGALLAMVTTKSPRAYLPYGPCCPEPIITYGEDKCYIGTDIHNPRNGQKVVDRFDDLCMSERVTLTQCMDSQDQRPLYYFEAFVNSLDEEEGALGCNATTDSPTSAPTDGDNEESEDTSSVRGLSVSMFGFVLAMCTAFAA